MRRPAPARARAVLSLLAAWVALVALAAPAAAEPVLPEGFQDETVFDGLHEPTTFRFAPDGRVFVAEKAGRILVFEGLEDTEPEVFADLRTDVYDTGDRGLLGIALDPEFTGERPYVYALYTYDHILGDAAPAPKWGTPETSGDPCPDYNGGDACLVSGRLVRLTDDEGHAKEVAGAPEQKVLAEGWCQQFSSHSIGDVEFGPEGALYASGGDGASFNDSDWGQLGTTPNPCGDPPSPAGTALQSPTSEGGSLRSLNPKLLNGKIIRVDPDTGKGLPTNPLSASPNENTKRIVALGFRNPFRFTFDPLTGTLYTGNVGSSEIEEIDRFAAPPQTLYNSGWPCYEGPERQFLFKKEKFSLCEALYANEPGSTSSPFFYYSHGQSVVPGDECAIESGSAVGGISLYDGGKMPGYEGALFFADSVRGCIWAMRAGADGHPDPDITSPFLHEGKIYPGVDIQEGPDGYLYYVDLFGDEEYGEGEIHRIAYNPGAPTAQLSATPPYGMSWPLNVNFDATESTDPDGDPSDLEYDWDMDGNGSFELLDGAPTQSRSFTKAEQEEREAHEESLNPEVAVRVTDEDGLTSVARVTVYPGDKPPVPTIEEPLSTLKWRVGDKIHLDGSAIDSAGDGIYAPLGYYWSTRLFHCPTDPEHCHAHPLQTFSGVRSGDFVAPEHEYPSYIGITLRVADYRGLSGSTTINIAPRTVNVLIGSTPPGIELTAGALQGPSPFSLTAIEGSSLQLVAPATAEIGGKTYTWQRWSDGGARIHSVIANGDACYQAIYSGPEDPRDPGPCVPAAQPTEPPNVDTIAPRPRLRSHPPKRSKKKVARFAFSANEPGSTFRCRLDRSAYKRCTSPRTYRRLKRGKHVFKLRATDPSGNASKPLTFTWKVLPRKRRAHHRAHRRG